MCVCVSITAAGNKTLQGLLMLHNVTALSSPGWSLWRCCPGDRCWDVTQRFSPPCNRRARTSSSTDGADRFDTHPSKKRQAGSIYGSLGSAASTVQQLRHNGEISLVAINCTSTTRSQSEDNNNDDCITNTD